MATRLLPENIDFEGTFPALSRRLRIGVVGGGRIAVTQAMAARLSDRWEIAAGALSSDPEQAKARGAQWFLPEDRCYSSYQEMAEKESQREDGIDAVMITTPNHVHFEAAEAFLNVGIDVLCDKPLTNVYSEAADLVALTESTGQVFGVCYAMSCFPMIRQAREMVKNGAIGKVVQIHVEFMQDWMIPDDVGEAAHVKWRLDPKKSGSTSCTGDIGTHAAQLATFVSGLDMTDLRAEMHVCGAPKPLEDTVFMMTRYEGNVPGTLMATRIASGNRGGLRLRVFGSEGGIEWDMENAEQLKYNKYGEPDRVLSRGQGHGIYPAVERFVRTGRGFPEGLIEAWANLYTEFSMAVAARKDGVTAPKDWLSYPTVEDGAKGVRFIEASVESNTSGGAWVSCQ
ncbi:Osmosensitive K+ channel histidine kinase KdpD [Grimontia indica]|uniref:Osmosensitive K+ channel histidine kinase KdpD n=1 Tax=Grimontia indica TaxID=1056512 RepID=R1IIH3_9GAMM|nr:Gfo/Idh/MocA family oxidoreductase [Grimontia indica]EOD77242.1 Osmosensitive K+ channel histidine kinase KdpD [Grimontia indica]